MAVEVLFRGVPHLFGEAIFNGAAGGCIADVLTGGKAGGHIIETEAIAPPLINSGFEAIDQFLIGMEFWSSAIGWPLVVILTRIAVALRSRSISVLHGISLVEVHMTVHRYERART